MVGPKVVTGKEKLLKLTLRTLSTQLVHVHHFLSAKEENVLQGKKQNCSSDASQCPSCEIMESELETAFAKEAETLESLIYKPEPLGQTLLEDGAFILNWNL